MSLAESPTIRPASEAETVEAVRDALAAGAGLELVGGGSRGGLGRPVAAARRLDLSALQGVAWYEPDELTIALGPATPMAELRAVLAGSGQHLAFDPPDLGPLLGGAAGRGTIGGAVACNLAGPARVTAGAARDHLLGVRAVTGRGEAIRAGGRVVKNVTGYDLCKLIAGSYGTLAAMTELTLKVLPAPEAETTLVLEGLPDEAAVAALCHGLGSAADVSAAAHLPAGAEGATGVPTTLLRLAGVRPSLAERADELIQALGDAAAGAPVRQVADEESQALWQAVRDVRPLWGGDGRPVWRISVPPAEGAALGADLRATGGGELIYDWGGGLVWYRPARADAADAGAAQVRGALAMRSGGHATLIRASAEQRGRVDVFQPLPPAHAALAERVRQSFDPAGILNPGRLYPRS